MEAKSPHPQILHKHPSASGIKVEYSISNFGIHRENSEDSKIRVLKNASLICKGPWSCLNLILPHILHVALSVLPVTCRTRLLFLPTIFREPAYCLYFQMNKRRALTLHSNTSDISSGIPQTQKHP